MKKKKLIKSSFYTTTRWQCQVNHYLIGTVWPPGSLLAHDEAALLKGSKCRLLHEYLRGIKETNWEVTNSKEVDIQGHCEIRQPPLRLSAQQRLLYSFQISYRWFQGVNMVCVLSVVHFNSVTFHMQRSWNHTGFAHDYKGGNTSYRLSSN